HPTVSRSSPTQSVLPSPHDALPSSPAAIIPAALGGGGASWASVLRVVREFARTDGSLAHLYGYHFLPLHAIDARAEPAQRERLLDRKSTRLHSSHVKSSDAVFCLNK